MTFKVKVSKMNPPMNIKASIMYATWLIRKYIWIERF